jgi:hypothetical protein
MTVTVNTLGPNSAEIIVTSESTAIPAMNAVETFLLAHGWAREASLGNTYERIYSAANLTTGTKYIKINALDLHIEHAESYSGTTTVTATNPAFRMVNNDHLEYGRDVYGDSTSSNAAFSSIVLTGSTTASTGISITIPAGQTETLYVGQFVRIVSRSNSSVWIDGIVSSQNNITGAVVLIRYAVGPGNTDASITDWSILTHKINYSTGTPSYIYISASARHVAIQVKYRDGQWGVWHAVMETENPAGVDVPSILTTSFMMSNSGFTNNSNASSTTNTGAIPDNTSAPSLTSIFNKFRLWCGPYSQPRSRKNRTGVTASRFSKISTPLGDAGPVGSQKRLNLGQVSSAGNVVSFVENIVYYKGLGDVIPNQTEPITGRQWAFSGVAVTDLTDNASWEDLSINGWRGWRQDIAFSVTSASGGSPGSLTSDAYRWSTANELSSWTTQSVTLLGRIHAIKFVTTGLPAGNIVSVKVNPSGFADDSGIAQDHLVMNYQSEFVADSRQGTTTILATPSGGDGAVAQSKIRLSQSASVAFPK